MKKDIKIKTITGFCFLFLIVSIFGLFGVGAAASRGDRPVYNVTCGPEGNTGFVVGGGAFPYMEKWTDGKVTVLPIASGSVAALRNVSEGEDIQGVFFEHVTMEEIWTNTGRFAKSPMKKKLYQTFYVWPTAWAIWAKKQSGIKSYSDLAGKKVSVGDPKSTFVKYIISSLDAMGLWKKIDNKYMGVGEWPDALKSGIIDACPIAIAANVVSPWGEQIALYNDMNALSITDEQIASVKKVPAMSFGYAKPVNLTKELGMDKIPGFMMYYGYHFAEGTDADVVYAIVKAWFGHLDHLAKTHVALSQYKENWKDIQKEGISAAPHAPVHPGAARYYKEIGLWQDGWLVGK